MGAKDARKRLLILWSQIILIQKLIKVVLRCRCRC